MTGHLVVIDLQQVFADPASDWHTPGFADLLAPLARLVDGYRPAVTFTRFVPPDQPRGAWQAYYQHWPFAVQPADAPLYRLAAPYADEPSLDLSTFGKWGPELAGRLDPATPELVLAGVATDCCVIATALAAVDAGLAVCVATDACAGGTDAGHRAALAVLAGYAPLVRLATVAELVGG